jgi:hypothetical protein
MYFGVTIAMTCRTPADEQGSQHKIALLMHYVELGAEMLHSFHFLN